MARISSAVWLSALLAPAVLVQAQQECYYGPGAKYRGPTDLVPCLNSGQSACCLSGDTCLSGNACYDGNTGNTYQYGCTDITYQDASCPFKCGFSPDKSPWAALEYCNDLGIDNTWVCESPESCGCSWNPSDQLLILPLRQCKEMGSDARVGLYAPSVLVPYVQLPTTIGGSTGYFSTTTVNGQWTWITTAIGGYTPDSIGLLSTYPTPAPNKVVQVDANGVPSPSTLHAASYKDGGTPSPAPSTSAAPSSSSSSQQPTSSSSSSNSGGATSSSSSSSGSTKSTSHHLTTTTNSAGSIITVTATPTPTPKPGGLSTGAKVGIGVGIAGAVCLAAAVALVIWILKRRKRQDHHPVTDPSFGAAYNEKNVHDSWTSNPSTSLSPGSYHHRDHSGGSAYVGSNAEIYEAGGSQRDEDSIRKRMSPPAAELDAGFGRSEMGPGSPMLPLRNEH